MMESFKMAKRPERASHPVCSFVRTADGYIVKIRPTGKRQKVITLGPFPTATEAAAQANEYLHAVTAIE